LGASMCQHGAHHFLPWAGRNSYNSIVCIAPHAPCFAPLLLTCISPINWATGECIISHNLKYWTWCRNIAWECFCGLLMEYCTPVRFKTNCHGHAMAYCHQSPSSLSEVRVIALYKSVYTDALTRGSSKLPTVYCTLIFQINPSQHILITRTMWICVIWYCESIMTDLQQHPADTLTFSLTSRVTVAPLAQH
jgi:hypothetical protein